MRDQGGNRQKQHDEMSQTIWNGLTSNEGDLTWLFIVKNHPVFVSNLSGIEQR